MNKLTIRSEGGSLTGKVIDHVEGSKHTLLISALMLAAEKYDEYAKEFSDLKPELVAAEAVGSTNFVHSRVCDPLATQFQYQAAGVRELIALFEGDGEDENAAERLILVYEED